MSDLTALTSFVMIYAIAVATPGPAIMAIIARTLGVGFRPTVPFMFGVLLGDLFYLTLAAFGLALVLSAFTGLLFALKIAGAAYLLYLAWKFWTAPISTREPGMEKAVEPAMRTFLSGLSLTIGNPKTIAFYLSLLPNVIDLTHLSYVDYAVLVLIVAVVLMTILFAYGALAARARIFLTTEKSQKMLNRGAGMLLASAALSIAAK